MQQPYISHSRDAKPEAVDLEKGAAAGLICHPIRLGGPIVEDVEAIMRLSS
jgi:hypothetical protein